MSQFRPKLPEGTFTITVDCPRCGCDVKLETTKSTLISTRHLCPSCQTRFFVDPDLDTWTLPKLVVFIVLTLTLLPLLLLDRLIWKLLNDTSVWLQKAVVTDKYTLALVAFVAGLVAFPVAEGWSGLIDSLIWGLIASNCIYWCWSKSQTAGDEESEVRRLEDELVLRESRWKRVLWGLVLGPTLGLFLLFVGNMWLVGMSLLNVGFYWMDSEYVPPRKRGLFDWGRQLAFGNAG